MLKRFTTISLIAALLLSGSIGALGHDHALESENNSACFVDHETSHLCDPSDDAHFDGAAARHEHTCVACHLARDRSPALDATHLGRVLNEASTVLCLEPPHTERFGYGD